MKIGEFLEDELQRREDLDYFFLIFILFSMSGRILGDGIIHSCCSLMHVIVRWGGGRVERVGR